MHFPQRLTDRAKVALVALSVFRKTMGQNDGPINGTDDFERRNLMRIARQPVSTIGSLFRTQEPGPRQFL